MAESIFEEKTNQPGLNDLYEALKESSAILKEIEAFIIEKYGSIEWEWKFYGKQAGWTAACRNKNRRLFHLIPKYGYFKIVFTLGKNGVSECLESSLPEDIKQIIRDAPVYAEGRTFRFDVKESSQIEAVRELVRSKILY